MTKKGRPRRKEFQNIVERLVEEKGFNFSDIGRLLNTSKQLVRYHYWQAKRYKGEFRLGSVPQIEDLTKKLKRL